jgi:hypothetical protein
MGIETGKLIVCCSNCNEKITYLAGQADFENSFGNERSMGTESGYLWEEDFNCSNCGKEISIRYEVWEYPVGALNHENLKIVGGETEETFGFNFFEPDDEN